VSNIPIPVGWGMANAPLMDRLLAGDPIAITYYIVASVLIFVALHRLLTGRWIWKRVKKE